MVYIQVLVLTYSGTSTVQEGDWRLLQLDSEERRATAKLHMNHRWDTLGSGTGPSAFHHALGSVMKQYFCKVETREACQYWEYTGEYFGYLDTADGPGDVAARFVLSQGLSDRWASYRQASHPIHSLITAGLQSNAIIISVNRKLPQLAFGRHNEGCEYSPIRYCPLFYSHIFAKYLNVNSTHVPK